MMIETENQDDPRSRLQQAADEAHARAAVVVEEHGVGVLTLVVGMDGSFEIRGAMNVSVAVGVLTRAAVTLSMLKQR